MTVRIPADLVQRDNSDYLFSKENHTSLNQILTYRVKRDNSLKEIYS
jgi:hypothetical protein